jgi:hypothetical protein
MNELGSRGSAALPSAPVELAAKQLPGIWRRLLAQVNVTPEEHPAQVVWVSPTTLTNDSVPFDRVPNVEFRVPPVPCAWAVFAKPLVVGKFTPAKSPERIVMLRSLEWQHRDDDTVIVIGYTVFVTPSGHTEEGVSVVAVMRPDAGLLQSQEAYTIASYVGRGPAPVSLTVTGGDPAVPPLFLSAIHSTRRLQRVLIFLADRLWDRWENPPAEQWESVPTTGETAEGGTVRKKRNGVGEEIRVISIDRPLEGFDAADPESVTRVDAARTEPDHRWRVRSHYRWQTCGPGGRYRRKILIHSHESGPRGKPLKDTPTVIKVR